MKFHAAVFAVSVWSATLSSQDKQAKPHFEVAAIKPAAPQRGEGGGISSRGGPGTREPGRYTTSNFSLRELLGEAYNIRRYQISGPASLDLRFDVNAKVPAGATKEQFRGMLQSLLEERFHLVTHWEKKESQVFELVPVKGGHKKKEHVEESAPSGSKKGGARQPGVAKEPGTVSIAMGMGTDGAADLRSEGMSTDQIARTISNYLHKPVVDATGLTGRYDVRLRFSMEGLPGGPSGARMGAGGGAREGAPAPAGTDAVPSLFTAVQEQLGLKLEQKKGMIDILVIDKIDRIPTAN